MWLERDQRAETRCGQKVKKEKAPVGYEAQAVLGRRHPA